MAHHITLLSDRTLLTNGFNAGKTYRLLPNGHLLATYLLEADHHGLPGGLAEHDRRGVQDGRTVVVSTLKCGLYRIDGLDGDTPAPVLIHTFDDQRCDMPAVVGRFWVQTLSAKHAIVSLDISNPSRPVEVDRLELGADNRPHWLGVEPGSGTIAIDTAFRDDGSAIPGINFNRIGWPHAGGPTLVTVSVQSFCECLAVRSESLTMVIHVW